MRDSFTRSAKWLWHRLRGNGLSGQASTTSLLVFRLENMAVLNDQMGKAGVGQLTVSLCVRLSRAIRPQDPVQVVAPGVFAVVLTNQDEGDVVRIARRLHQAGQVAIAAGGNIITPVLTGLVVHADTASAVSLAQMTEVARSQLDDLALESLGTVLFFDAEMSDGSSQVADTISAAANAGQIVAHFQPQVSCHTGEITGFEALARWQHPTRGLLMPDSFMHTMTDIDYNLLTLAMLRQALSALKEWDAQGWRVPTVSLNISKCELAEPSFATALLWELDRQEIEPSRLVLEVLESVGPLSDNSKARENLGQLTRAGCKLDLDDFGTGYACFDAIRQFGIHRIKIDRSFVTGCDVDPAQQRMILAILALSERLGIAALAEGAETPEEHSYLAQLGCDEVQGFAVARPMPFEHTLAFLARHAARSVALPQIQQRSTG